MQIHLLAIGNRMPEWVTQGYQDYAKRLPRECELVLREIPPGKRGKNADLERIKEDEGERMLAMIQRDDHVIALEVEGKAWRTETLAAEMARWLTMGQRIILLVGGPEGLADACKTRAHQTWSLSPLTLPHPLVRILLAEQLYRAQTILSHHPYHR